MKRAFTVSKLCAGRTHKGHMKKVTSEKEYVKRVEHMKKKVLAMKESALNTFIIADYKKRFLAFEASDWYLAEFSPKELGVWNRAGEMPLRWTNRSLEETAQKVKWALDRKNGFRKKHIRAAHAIPGILQNAMSIIQEEKYLFPIAFKCDTGTRGRARLKTKMVADLDDGCMRSIALTVSGSKKIMLYFGVPKKDISQTA